MYPNGHLVQLANVTLIGKLDVIPNSRLNKEKSKMKRLYQKKKQEEEDTCCKKKKVILFT